MKVSIRIINLLRPYAAMVLIALSFTTILTLLNLPMPYIVQVLIDDVVIGGKWHILNWLLLIIILLFVVQGIFSYFNTYFISKLAQKVIYDLRMSIYHKLHSLSLSFYDRMRTGTIISRMMDDVNMLQSIMTGSTISIFTDLITLLIVIVVLFFKNWKMTLVVLAFLPFYAINFRLFIDRIRTASLAIREKMDDIFGVLQERIAGVQVVKAFSRERFETREFVAENRESLDLNMWCAFLGMSFSSISGVISGIGTASILCLGGYEVIKGTMKMGEMMAFCSLAGYLFGPAARLTEITYLVQQANVSMARIFEILDTVPDVRESKMAVALPKVDGHVEFRSVSFGYTKEKAVLSDINLDIQPGTIVALVGKTGSGKSSIVSLLLRFYEPQEGSIMIDGYDISKVTFHSLRSQIGVVLQDPMLFNVTIEENIRYGKEDATLNEIIEAAKVAELHNFITSLQEGYNSRLGEEGIKLSVGEKQRLAIARALVGHPSIIVLDEATSSLDSESESLIQKAMENLMKGRTCFVIAHRLSTVVNADLILVLDNGRIVESGRHDELLQDPKGYYNAIYKIQFAPI